MDDSKPLIAYIEIDTHAEIANNFWELTHNSQELVVDYYFSEKILTLLNKREHQNIFKVSYKNLFQKLSSKQYDLVIIGTAHRYFNTFLEIAESFPTAIIGHNLNFIKSRNIDLFKSLFKKDTKFRFKLLLKEGLLQKNKLYQKAITTFVLDKYMTTKSYPVLPLFFNIFHENTSNTSPLIVIPGTVSQKRRDYLSILKTLNNINIPMNVTFLGKANGKELKWLKNFEQENILHKISYFTQKISQKSFDNIMKTADVLWCPIKAETEFFSIKETYGKTKISGNIGDAIKYGKWAIFPESYVGKYPFVISEKEIFNKKTSIPEINEFSKQKITQQIENILKDLITMNIK